MRKLNRTEKKIFFNLTFLLFIAVLVTALIFSSVEPITPSSGGQFSGVIGGNSYTSDAYGCYINGNTNNAYYEGNSVCAGSTIMMCRQKWSWWPFNNFAGFEWVNIPCPAGCQQSQGNSRTAVCPAKIPSSSASPGYTMP